jgi:hypothetical protein
MGRGFRVTKEPPKIEPKKWVTTIGLWIAYFRVMKHILVVLEARHTNRYYHSTFSGSASRCRIIILFWKINFCEKIDFLKEIWKKNYLN